MWKMRSANLDEGLAGCRLAGGLLRALRLKDFIHCLGLCAGRILSSKRANRHLETRRTFETFVNQHGPALGLGVVAEGASRTALWVASDSETRAAWELGVVKALQMAGFRVIVLARRAVWVRWYFGLAGVERVLFWDSFTGPVPMGRLRRIVEGLETVEDLFELHYQNVRVGKSAASTTLRHTRSGTVNLGNAYHCRVVMNSLAGGLKYAMASERILGEINPDLVLFSDRGYNRNGMMFDLAIAQARDTVTWNAAHKSNSIILKRFTKDTCDVHPCSLSDASWDFLQNAPWSREQEDAVVEELRCSYTTGEWYSEVGTQFDKKVLDSRAIRTELGLDPARKTILVFPHILWDGTFFWGTDLFPSYEAWLVETLKAAAANDRVNWVVKIHPANTVKNMREGHQGEPAEVLAARAVLEDWPEHIKFLPADSPINTFSLFQIMDLCLTVRGTIGIEAAAMGIPVVTGGTGRYDRRGFTVDPDTAGEYLQLLAALPELPSMSSCQKELALRFAHAVFLNRPLEMESFQFHFQRDETASTRVQITVDTAEQLEQARDLRRLAEWFADRNRLDYLNEGPT